MDGVAFVSTNSAVAFSGGKKIPPDKLMAAGTLMLVDPSHSKGGFTGVPSNGSVITNIAADYAATLTGQAASTLHPAWGTTANPTDLVVERTPKGGFHVMSSQSTQATGRYVTLLLPSAIRDYMYAHMDNVFALTLWRRVARAANAAPNPYLYLGNAPGVNQGLITLIHTGASPTTTNAVRTLTGGANQNVVANMNEQIKAAGWSGNKPTNVSQIGQNLAAWGTGAAGPWGSGGQNISPSSVLYRLAFEDLTATAAARTAAGELNNTVAARYAEFQSLDSADWAAAFAAGGRYYGDTWSDPATVIP